MACADREPHGPTEGPPRPFPAAPARHPAGRSAPPAALTAFFFCTILSIFLAMRTTSSSMAAAGIHRAQPVWDGMWAKLGQRRQEGASSGTRAARHSRPGPRPFHTNQAGGGGGAVAPPPQGAPIELRALLQALPTESGSLGRGPPGGGSTGAVTGKTSEPGGSVSRQAVVNACGPRVRLVPRVGPRPRIHALQFHPRAQVGRDCRVWNPRSSELSRVWRMDCWRFLKSVGTQAFSPW